MAIKEFPNVSPDANATFGLEENTTEFNSVLTKTAQHMTLPGAKWRGSVSFTNRSRQEANKVKAFKAALGGKAGRFYLTPFDAYQNGTMTGTGLIDGAVASGVSSLPTTGWEADQDTLFEFGDYIEVNGELKMVTDDVSGSDYIEYVGTNLMPSPFDPSGWNTDEDASITTATEQNPSGNNSIGIVEQTGAGTAVFCQSSGGSFLSGDSVYLCCIVKKDVFDMDLSFYFQEDASFDRMVININDGEIKRTSAKQDVSYQDLGEGWRLIQVKNTLTTDVSVCRGEFRLRDGSLGLPPIGSKCFMQAAYFGKADDYPSQLLASADIPIAPPLRKALTGGESITVDSPKGKFYLGSDSQEWSINVNGVQDMGFDFIEDIN